MFFSLVIDWLVWSEAKYEMQSLNKEANKMGDKDAGCHRTNLVG
jgi:hypothetical protein